MTDSPVLALVVDDHDAARYAKVQYVRRAGYRVVEAPTGQDAIRLTRETDPDIVLLDVNLPDMSGLEVCRVLKKITGSPAVQILQISSTAVTDADRVKGLEGGADAYLTEPVSSDIVLATMEALLRVRRAERAMIEAMRRESLARAEAERANRFKDEFLATLSHELRTPLNAMVGWIWHLRQQGDDPALRLRALDSLERSTAIQIRLINDLLDVSRIDRGKLELELADVDLEAVIKSAIETSASLASVRNITFAVRTSPARVFGDLPRLDQIATNLITNAVQFSRTGGVIEVMVETDTDEAILRVRDHGQGIESELLPHVFDPFRQGEGGFARRHGGLGLGLAIVRQLVALHEGTVTAESDGPGEGATFTVRLPLNSSVRRGRPAPIGLADHGLVGTRVLIVDDDDDSRHWLSSLITSAGGHAAAADSASTALQVLDSHEFDLLLSDIGMPGQDGLQLLLEVRRRGLRLPAVAVTAFVSADEQARILRAGYDFYLMKPVDPEILLRTLAAARKRERPVP